MPGGARDGDAAQRPLEEIPHPPGARVMLGRDGWLDGPRPGAQACGNVHPTHGAVAQPVRAADS